jgi:predicted nucleic-acid-binding protein
MRAVDTNILVRLLTADDAREFAVAQAVFRGPVWIAKTVLLETAWVLGKVYEFGEPTIAESFRRLLSLREVSMEDEAGVLAALGLVDGGIELADALHLCSRPADAPFVSFDQKLIRRAKRAGVASINAPIQGN